MTTGVGFLPGVAIAGWATVVAMGLMSWSRAAFQIRTLPERVMEWTLLFVPPEVLESGIGRFGPDAKTYAFYAATVGMAAILVLVGTLVLARARSPWAVWASGPLLYLVAMGTVVPITGGGLFGSELFQDPWLVNACYLGIALAYASVLLLGRWLLAPGAASGTAAPASASSQVVARRAFLAGLVPSAASLLAALWLGQRGGRSSSLPVAKVEPTPGPAAAPTAAIAQAQPTAALTPTPVPTELATPAAGPTSDPAPTVAPTEARAAPAAEAALPKPEPLGKQVARGEYGAVTGGTRQPGTLAELITETDSHYQVTKNPVSDPVVEPEGWRLILDGELERPVQLDYRTLRQLPTVEIAKTLECISNYTSNCELVPYGCELIGTAVWKGVPLQDLFRPAGGLKPGVVSVSLLGADEFSSTIPIDVALDPGTILAYEMNGAVLPYEHGYPARVLAPGRYGYKSAKWVAGIRPNRRDVADWYAQRNWDREGVVETMTRIDLPVTATTLPAGRHRVAGIAYAGDRGISGVEYSVDDRASWRAATILEPAPAKDAWVRWAGSFELQPGQTVRLFARATDGTGQLQTETFAIPAPGGATGWPSVQVRGE